MRDCVLTHYGVKGMHWGVRRYQDYDEKDKKKALTISKKIALGAGIVAGSMLAVGFARSGGKTLVNLGRVRLLGERVGTMNGVKDKVIKPGTNFYHVFDGKVATGMSEFKQLDRKYATYTKRDLATYETFLDAKAKGHRFVETTKNLKEIKIPSDSKAVDFHNSLFSRSDIRSNMSPKAIRYFTKAPSEHSMAFALQYEVAQNPNGYVAKEYKKLLIDNGYNAVTDYIDRGVLGRAPLILLEPNTFSSPNYKRISIGRRFMDVFKLSYL